MPLLWHMNRLEPACVLPDCGWPSGIRLVPVITAGLDDATSAELGALLNERHQRMKNRRRGSFWATVVFLLDLAGGGYGWFIQSPQRVQAFHDALDDIRSVGDFPSIVTKYKKSLEKIKVRTTQIDRASSLLGISPNQR